MGLQDERHGLGEDDALAVPRRVSPHHHLQLRDVGRNIHDRSRQQALGRPTPWHGPGIRTRRRPGRPPPGPCASPGRTSVRDMTGGVAPEAATRSGGCAGLPPSLRGPPAVALRGGCDGPRLTGPGSVDMAHGPTPGSNRHPVDQPSPRSAPRADAWPRSASP
nr:ANTAR domain-containing protein [Streptomyces sp. MK7]